MIGVDQYHSPTPIVPTTTASGTSSVPWPVTTLLYECSSWKSASSLIPDELNPHPESDSSFLSAGHR